MHIAIFFYLGFLSRRFMNSRTAGEGGGHLFNFSLPLPPTSQTLIYQLGDYRRELTSAHSQQPDSNQEHLVSERKLLTTKLRALASSIYKQGIIYSRVEFTRDNHELQFVWQPLKHLSDYQLFSCHLPKLQPCKTIWK